MEPPFAEKTCDAECDHTYMPLRTRASPTRAIKILAPIGAISTHSILESFSIRFLLEMWGWMSPEGWLNGNRHRLM